MFLLRFQNKSQYLFVGGLRSHSCLFTFLLYFKQGAEKEDETAEDAQEEDLEDEQEVEENEAEEEANDDENDEETALIDELGNFN